VAEAVRVYKESLRPAIAGSVPFWPIGLPRWTDQWVALGLRAPGTSHLAVWHRGSLPGSGSAEGAPQADGHGAGTLTMPVPHLRGRRVTPRVLYPRQAGAEADWDAARGTLTITIPNVPSACVLRLEP
jgi:alpha-galactosidase